MRLYAKQGFGGRVFDLDTGLKVPKVIWVDTDPGLPSGKMLLEAWTTDQAGNVVRDSDGTPLFYQAQGRFKIVPNEDARRTLKPRLSAPNCVACGSLLTLPGYDLCVFCNAVDKGVVKFKVEPISPFEVVGCQRPGCNRQATYQVSDEVEAGDVVSKVEGVGRLVFDRAAIVNRRWYCDFHYKPPRILDPKGEVIEVLEDRRTT